MAGTSFSDGDTQGKSVEVEVEGEVDAVAQVEVDAEAAVVVEVDAGVDVRLSASTDPTRTAPPPRMPHRAHCEKRSDR
jgi:hypothetical protein